MRRNVQNGAYLVAALAERDPTQTLELSCRQVWPILAKYLDDEADWQSVSTWIDWLLENSPILVRNVKTTLKRELDARA
jgi:hypothetical protein